MPLTCRFRGTRSGCPAAAGFHRADVTSGETDVLARRQASPDQYVRSIRVRVLHHADCVGAPGQRSAGRNRCRSQAGNLDFRRRSASYRLWINTQTDRRALVCLLCVFSMQGIAIYKGAIERRHIDR